MEDRLYRITLTGKQLGVMINAIEDWHRFVCGQTTMDYATSFLPIDRMKETREVLDKDVKAVMFPELLLSESYSWNGGHKDNPAMSEVAAITYMLYRELRHRLSILNFETKPWDIYRQATMQDEQQGKLITLEEIRK